MKYNLIVFVLPLLVYALFFFTEGIFLKRRKRLLGLIIPVINAIVSWFIIIPNIANEFRTHGTPQLNTSEAGLRQNYFVQIFMIGVYLVLPTLLLLFQYFLKLRKEKQRLNNV